MHSKSLIFLVFFGFVTFVVFPVSAQTPEPQRDRGAQGMVWSFDGGSYLGVQTIEVNRANFSLYFNFWDRLMGTNHARYVERFAEAVGEVEPAKHVVPASRPEPVEPATPSAEVCELSYPNNS